MKQFFAGFGVKPDPRAAQRQMVVYFFILTVDCFTIFDIIKLF